MKHVGVKTSLLSAIALAVVGFSGVSFAHTVSPGQSLASSSILNVDVYTVSCFTEVGGNGAPQRFVGNVTKTSGSGSLRISVGRLSTVATGASVTTSTLNVPSAFAQVAAVNGSQHIATIGHSSAVANNYTANLHCETPAANALPLPESLNIEAGTTISGGTSTGGGNPIINQ